MPEHEGSEFSPTPSAARRAQQTVVCAPSGPPSGGAVGVPVGATGAVPPSIGFDRDRLRAAGFDASVGSTLVVATAAGPTPIAVGIGAADNLGPTELRSAAAAFARAAATHGDLTFSLEDLGGVAPDIAAQAVVEGILLARYRYEPLQTISGKEPVAIVTLVAGAGDEAAVTAGAARGQAFAGATEFARDLASTPHSHLNATILADLATKLGPERGLEVQVFDKEALIVLGCGGLLGVNKGSTEPPRMIKLTYQPAGAPTGRLALVGKGIMYDSGGLALKPGDEVHAQMKNDMSGAAAVLAAMSELGGLQCPIAVTGYLMCTDNMPSGTAMALGDVITMRGGTTVEVVNTDAEGRLVMADALVLSTEEPNDAIVDIATLTGACMRALGTQVAGVFGTNQPLVDQVAAAGAATDESVWQLPLERRYRRELDSPTADLRNLGGVNAGAITAALFLAEFVGDVPWAHLDIAGTAQSHAETSWHSAGCSGFGARLLLQLALDFTPPTR